MGVGGGRGLNWPVWLDPRAATKTTSIAGVA